MRIFAAAENRPLDVQDLLVRARRLARHVWQHFKDDRCFEEAASLGYTSLIALVPLLAVIFGIVAAFPVFSQWSSQLQSFIFSNLMPAAGEQVENYLATFLESVSGLTLPGTVFLILTALLLMFRIEVAFNRIWRVGRSRSLTARIVVYWAVLTLAPIMIGAAVALSARMLFGGVAVQAAQNPVLYRLGIFGMTWMVFALIFVLVPNRRVRFRDALAGAFVSALLFELAKVGFVAYVSNANYTVIYGALATVPIFLFWLYLVWIVVLLGASLAASLTTFRDRPRAGGDWSREAELQMAFRLVGHLWRAQRQGQTCTHEGLLALEPRVGERQMLGILGRLEESSIVVRDDAGDWMLARDAGDLTLRVLYRCGQFHLPVQDGEPVHIDSDWDRVYATVLNRAQREGLRHLDRPLRELYLEGEHE
ncbi:YihY family inner membrane protein [Wenzhouxiangellaceae bacterium CH-27]|uniref:UPF0761 membrane protein V3330_15240 n=1 Tax=Elongatibacter sediminis TaxID=3119006 RepID=A0AAW9RN71_9GAMM